jgi:hypothetical protein
LKFSETRVILIFLTLLTDDFLGVDFFLVLMRVTLKLTRASLKSSCIAKRGGLTK